MKVRAVIERRRIGGHVTVFLNRQRDGHVHVVRGIARGQRRIGGKQAVEVGRQLEVHERASTTSELSAG
jgi:hypothetical protein